MNLPPFPVDTSTLDLIDAALTGVPGDERRSSIGELCLLLSQMGGSDTDASRTTPTYHPNDVIAALSSEVRRLREVTNRARTWRWSGDTADGHQRAAADLMAAVDAYDGGAPRSG